MKKVLITGSEGFIGSNLVTRLESDDEVNLVTFDINNSEEELNDLICESDFIFHLAGINRPENVEDFHKGNTELSEKIITILNENKLKTTVLLTSSIQSTLENPYGKSKKVAEELLRSYEMNGGEIYIYRLSNVFGKWCRPNYNSVTATFCHNIANGENITISDRNHTINFIYIDDIIDEFVSVLKNGSVEKKEFYSIVPSYNVTLGYLADTIYSFKKIQETLLVPDFSDEFVKKLYATYLSYLPENSFSYKLKKNVDDRGDLFELIKSKQFGQIFVSTTKPGVTRGNHYHHTKNEKFCIIRGEGEIKFRHLITNKIISYTVRGDQPEVIDIPPGYTHSITNIGETELITLFWASEIFDIDNPDTFFEEVEK